ncbi:MAG: alpha-E domain-containing protein [Alphaproteobacteria bacterium]|nr:alpha-E domain-containing protein [Alphaproteobacteria bacterium]MBL6850416.1 alpha-E domain-containing protein [Alphaproteobacteria bacterium]
MLGSTADSLFWMFRYIERAENTLCLIESGFQLHLISSKNLKNEWDAILKTSSIRQFFVKNNTQLDSLTIINFMFKDEKNSNNIYQLISKARENARRSRVAITLEVWESVNTCWLYLNEQTKKNVTENKVQTLIKNIREKIALIYGFLQKTMLKDEIMSFCSLGTYIEKFNNTARILNTRQYLLVEEKLYGLENYNNFQLEMILRSISSYRSFMWKNQNTINSKKVSNFLISDKDMPRSLIFSIQETLRCIKVIQNRNIYKSKCYKTAQQIQKKIKSRKMFSNNYSFLNDLIELNMKLANQIEEEFNFH